MISRRFFLILRYGAPFPKRGLTKITYTVTPTDLSSENTSVKNAGSALIRSMSRDIWFTMDRHL